jgi:uncharacterized repeat protein (TIGR01451 family)
MHIFIKEILMNILRYLRYVPKRFALVLSVVLATTTVATTLAWGPSRQTFTTAHPADHIVFNSITDNPSVGDERDFVVVKEADNQNAGGWTNSINAVAGKEYLIRVYVHNNAADQLKLKAQNTRVSVALPTNTGKNIAFSGFVTADNASPKQVWDDAAFTSSSDFNIAYIPGSARLYNNVTGQAGRAVSDSIVTSAGAQVGYDSNNGVVPGCYQYASYVTLKVKVQGPVTSNFEVTKSVRKAGEQTWSENVNAKAGETVQYRIKYTNKGTAQADNVTAKDTLPSGVSYVKGSTKLYLGSDPNTARPVSDSLTTSGINIGSYAPGGMAMVIFDATVNQNDALPVCGTNTLRNVATVTVGGTSKEDDATVTAEKVCTTPQPETPTTPAATTPEALPSTGPEAVLGGLFGSSALGYGAYSYFSSRRTLLSRLLKR